MTAAQVARRMQARAQAVEREFKRTMETVREEAQQECRRLLQEGIYSVPEDTNAAGEKEWERTEKLLNGEKAEITSEFTVRITNDQPYAAARHAYGGPDDNRKVNPARVSHWRDELVETFRPRLQELYHEAQQAILKRTES